MAKKIDAGKNDDWKFCKDKAGEWRWRRKAPSHKLVGAAHEGYKRRIDCEANARRARYRGKLRPISQRDSRIVVVQNWFEELERNPLRLTCRVMWREATRIARSE